MTDSDEDLAFGVLIGVLAVLFVLWVDLTAFPLHSTLVCTSTATSTVTATINQTQTVVAEIHSVVNSTTTIGIAQTGSCP